MVILQNEYLYVEIHERGAELHSLKLIEDMGTEYIWQRNPQFWDAQSPMLFPIVGSLKGGTYRYKGNEYSLPIHGFANTEIFEIEQQSTNGVTFLLENSPRTMERYPFEFSLRLCYSLEGRKLSFHYTVDNTGDKEIYFSLGAHPGFLLQEPIHHYYLLFEQNETIYPYRTHNKLVMETPDACILADCNRLPLDYDLFAKGAFVCKDLRSNKLRLCSDHLAKVVEIGWNGFTVVGIWTKENAPYVCIEPWTGHGDTESCSGNIAEKPLITRLDKGAQYNSMIYICIEEWQR
jgi:galactose mutarotase-like enzyme